MRRLFAMNVAMAAALTETLTDTLTVAILLILPTANATPICRWVDKAGHTQVASKVPDRYQALTSDVCSDIRSPEPKCGPPSN